MPTANYGTFLYGELFYGQTSKFTITTVVHTYLNLRVNFNEAAIDNAELRDISNYNIIVTSPSIDYDFEVLAVTPEAVTNPTYVDLMVTDCTHGGDYQLVITPDKIQNVSTAYMESGYNTKLFTGVSELPDVLTAHAVSSTSVRVTFSKTMAVNDEYLDPSNYSFTGGLVVKSVEAESESVVLLTTTEQEIGQIYDLTVT